MFTFRKTTFKEADCLAQWHATPVVKRWVPIDNWQVYFQAVTNLKNYYLYSVYHEGKIIAHIAGEVKEDAVAICLVVDPMRHGQGIGTAVLVEMQRQTQSLFGHVNAYVAGIFPENISSIKCFEKAGYIKERKGNDGEDMYFYIL